MAHFFIHLQDFVNLRIHRNSLGIHLNNLLRKDSDDDDNDGNELNSNGDYMKEASHSNEKSKSSKIGLNQLMVKYLAGKLGKNKKSGSKLVVTFDLHSTSKTKIRNTQNGATTSDDAESDESYSTDESPGIDSDGKLNTTFRCTKIKITITIIFIYSNIM